MKASVSALAWRGMPLWRSIRPGFISFGQDQRERPEIPELVPLKFHSVASYIAVRNLFCFNFTKSYGKLFIQGVRWALALFLLDLKFILVSSSYFSRYRRVIVWLPSCILHYCYVRSISLGTFFCFLPPRTYAFSFCHLTSSMHVHHPSHQLFRGGTFHSWQLAVVKAQWMQIS
jgi:hypothetical protein